MIFSLPSWPEQCISTVLSQDTTENWTYRNVKLQHKETFWHSLWFAETYIVYFHGDYFTRSYKHGHFLLQQAKMAMVVLPDSELLTTNQWMTSWQVHTRTKTVMTLTWCQNWSFLHILHVNVTSLTQILWYLSEHTCRYIEWMNLIAKKLVMEFFYIVISVLEKWSESISCCSRSFSFVPQSSFADRVTKDWGINFLTQCDLCCSG